MARRPRILVTGCNGLVGSAVVRHFHDIGWDPFGLDNNLRASFFGKAADTRWMQLQLEADCPRFRHRELDIRDRPALDDCLETVRPDLIAHAAAQPSHDLAAQRPFDDFEVNALGTLNLLELARRHVPETVFVFLSTNKVYGDAPNERTLQELDTRWDYALPEDRDGIDETCRVDQSTHSLFGASKLAADVMVQEYGRYFGMKTCCLRAGCITGVAHSAVQLHGFLGYLVKVATWNETYRVFGHRGKQVRDNIEAGDVASFIELFHRNPRPGQVYNIGGGRENSCSILEAIAQIEDFTGQSVKTEILDTPRRGDHICYLSNLNKIRNHYPDWRLTKSVPQMLELLCESWAEKLVNR